MKRRHLLGLLGRLSLALPLLAPLCARAARLTAFATRRLEDTLNTLDAAALPAGAIRIEAPEIAENGALVPVAVAAPTGTRRLQLIAEHNPYPLLLSIEFDAQVRPRLDTRIRLAESCAVRVLAFDAAGHGSMARRQVGVTVGGCGS